MMRFPLRLTAELTKVLIAQRLRFGRAVHPVLTLDAAEILLSGSSHPIAHEKIREITDSGSPAVWIGGSEPLGHPGIAHLVRAIMQSGHFVFLETDGTALRRRIHEFQPVPRLFLTVRMDSGMWTFTSGRAQPGPSNLAVEGLRAARLSGFSVCVFLRVTAATNLREAAELFDAARSLDVDGIVVSPARGESNSANPEVEALCRNTVEARKLIGNKWWESFSRLVDHKLEGNRHSLRGGDLGDVLLEQESHANDEGVRVG
jgi:hypothetical protein